MLDRPNPITGVRVEGPLMKQLTNLRGFLAGYRCATA